MKLIIVCSKCAAGQMSMRAKKVRSSRASFSNWEIGSQGNGTGWTGISGSLKDKYKYTNLQIKIQIPRTGRTGTSG